MARGRPSRATVYSRLDAAMTELRERLGGLPSPTESEFIWSDIWHLDVLPREVDDSWAWRGDVAKTSEWSGAV